MFLAMYIWNTSFCIITWPLGVFQFLYCHYFNRVCHSVFQHLFCISVTAAEVSIICCIVLGWKHYEVFLCKNLLLRFLFTCGSTFHLCGGVGLVCMKLCDRSTSTTAYHNLLHLNTKNGISVTWNKGHSTVYYFASYYVHKKSTQLSILHLMQHVSTSKMSSSC